MSELKRSLGYGTIIALSITSMIGTGMFVGPGIAARYSGNMSLIAWGVLLFISVYVSLVFGELVSMFPNAGGVYEFAKRAYGRFASFMIGWVTWLVGNITTCVLIVAALNLMVPAGFTFSFLPNMSTELLKILLAILLVLAMNYVAYRGVDASAVLLMFFAVVTMVVIFAILVPGLGHINTENFSPFFMNTTPLKNGLLVFLSLFFILETYFGWESATFLAEETKNAAKIIPYALLITTIVVAIVGLLFAIMMLGNIPQETLVLYGEQEATRPLQEISSMLYPPVAWTFFKTGVFIALIGSAAGGIVSTPRLLLALSRDKLFINSFAVVHPKTKTPYKAIMFQTIITIIIVVVGFAEYETLLSMLVPLALIMYISVMLAVPILRFRMPTTPRTFKAPLGRVGPIIVSGIFISIIASWLFQGANAFSIFKTSMSFVLFGLPIYLLLMVYYDPDVIVKLNDLFAYFTLAFERVLIPKKIDRKIIDHLGEVRGHTILEFGCGVGTFTKELAKIVGPEGKIYATDVSYTQVKIAHKRVASRGHLNVQFIHDIHQVNRVHHSIPFVNAIVSIGMLGYLQDIRKVLREMHSILPEHGRLLFMDYIDLFKVIPNVSWLSNKDELVKLFRECGFSVKIEYLKGTLWNYLFIYGIKSEDDVPYI